MCVDVCVRVRMYVRMSVRRCDGCQYNPKVIPKSFVALPENSPKAFPDIPKASEIHHEVMVVHLFCFLGDPSSMLFD